MNTRAFVLAHVLVLAAALPAAGAPQDATGLPRLVRARYEVDPRSPTEAHVRVALEFSTGAPVSLLLTWFAGQEVTGLTVRGSQSDVAADDASELAPAFEAGLGRVRRLVLPAAGADARSVYLDYDVTVPATSRYRYPLAVPEIATDTTVMAVTVEVLLPVGGDYRGDGFPNFERAGERSGRQVLRSRLVGVPGFVHVVYADHGFATPTALIQASAVLFVFLPFLWFGARHWRRKGTPVPGGER